MVFGKSWQEPSWYGKFIECVATSPTDRRFTFRGAGSSESECQAAVNKSIESFANKLGIEPPSDIEYDYRYY